MPNISQVNFHDLRNCKDFNKHVVKWNWWPWLHRWCKIQITKKNQFSGQNAKVQFSVTERSNLIGFTAAINRLVKQILLYFTVHHNGIKNKLKLGLNFYFVQVPSRVAIFLIQTTANYLWASEVSKNQVFKSQFISSSHASNQWIMKIW